MSAADVKAAGMSQGPSSNKINPSRLFIVGHDGDGATEAERVEWLRRIFPKLAERFKVEDTDPRAGLPISEDEIRVFRPAHADPVKYESMGVSFPDECGRWSGLKLLVVVTGRQTTKLARILNERRVGDGSPEIEIVVQGRRFASVLDRIEANVIENRQIKPTTPTQRAWGAQRLIDNGATRDDAMLLCGVKTEQGLTNLLALLDCSPAVQAALAAGPDNGGITQRVALEIAKKGDHDKQDEELARRLGAAAGKKGRARAQAMNGSEKMSKPIKPARAKRIVEHLKRADRSEMKDPHAIDAYVAIMLYMIGDDAGYDALPDGFRAVVIAAEKKVPAEKSAAKAKQTRARKKTHEPAAPANDSAAVDEREAA